MSRIASVLLFLGLALLTVAAPAATQAAEQISAWRGGERHDFQVNGRAAILVCPQKEASGRPWIWRMEFFDHEPQADAALLALGWHVAYLDVQNLYGSPTALDAMDVFYDRMRNGRGLAAKVVLEGFSRGGLFSFGWAARHPDRVSSIYNDAPVCDFTTWPGGRNGGKRSDGDWNALLKVWNLTEEEALSGIHCPLNRLEPLAKAKIPILHVCGDADEAVPFAANTGVLAERYRALGGEIKVIAKPGGKHHPHSLPDPAPIVNFVTAVFKPERSDVAAGTARPSQIDPALPDVLLIGDSISIGYTPEVRRLLAGKANVWRIPVNGGPTTRGLKYLDDWLQGRKWHLIHFNWGLHDLKYVAPERDAKSGSEIPSGKVQVALPDYEKNLRELCTRLRQTDARLIWAETTYIPDGAVARVPGHEILSNGIAATVMKEAGISVNALWELSRSQPEMTRPNVHFLKSGYAALAARVAEEITKALPP